LPCRNRPVYQSSASVFQELVRRNRCAVNGTALCFSDKELTVFAERKTKFRFLVWVSDFILGTKIGYGILKN